MHNIKGKLHTETCIYVMHVHETFRRELYILKSAAMLCYHNKYDTHKNFGENSTHKIYYHVTSL